MTSPRSRTPDESGTTLIEILLAGAMLAIGLTALAGTIGVNLGAVSKARDMEAATHFVEETLDSLSAQPYDNVLVMNGNTFFSQATAAQSLYRINLTVAQNELDLLTITAQLIDNRSGDPLSRFVIYRSRR